MVISPQKSTGVQSLLPRMTAQKQRLVKGGSPHWVHRSSRIVTLLSENQPMTEPCERLSTTVSPYYNAYNKDNVPE